MTFVEAIKAASLKADITKEQKASIAKAVKGAPKHPRIWTAAEHITAHRYERQTGNKVGANFDWATILDWLIKNLPTLISILMMLFGL